MIGFKGAKLPKGGLSALPANDRYIKVSRNECKRARAECKTTSLAAKSAPEHSRYQRGARAERKLIEDIATNIKGKKMILFVDAFLGVGDRMLGYYELMKDTGGEAAKPLLFFFGCDPRDHFFGIAKTRLVEKAMKDFNSQDLSIHGYCPMPTLPAAWAGKVPDECTVRAAMLEQFKVASVDERLNFLLPQEEDVPVKLTDDLRATLKELQGRFPGLFRWSRPLRQVFRLCLSKGT